ncbi:MAG TPA: hypothetical protein VN887_13585 [Candidatus Angelobacter sp.]|nr:hypothetical protein [Candidatus Angelobacter sp.]
MKSAEIFFTSVGTSIKKPSLFPSCANYHAACLPLFHHNYNFHRTHSALNYLPPGSRLPKTADNLSSYNS